MKAFKIGCLLAAICVLAAACGSSGGSAASHSGGSITFASIGGTSQAVLEGLIAKFTKETGIKVNYIAGTVETDYSQVAAERANPKIDVTFTNPGTQAEGDAAGLFAPVSSATVPNLSDAYSSLRSERFGVPVDQVAEGIEYNAQAFAKAGIPAPTSLNDLFDPRLKGHVAIYSTDVDYSTDLLVALASISGGSQSDIGPGFAKLQELKSSGIWAYTPTTTAEMDTLITQGQVWATFNGSSRVALLAAQKVPVRFVIPSPAGGVLTANYLAVVKNAPNGSGALKFVNFMLGTSSQLTFCSAGDVSPANAKVVFPPALAREVPNGTNVLSKMMELNAAQEAKELPTWLSTWQSKLG